MRRPAVVAYVVAAGLALVVVGVAARLVQGQLQPPEPLAGYGPATMSEAAELGRRIAEALDRGDGAPFDEAVDVEAVVGQMLGGFSLGAGQRAKFTEGFRQGLAKNGSFGTLLVRDLGDSTRVVHLRARLVAGHQRAVLRIKPEDGVNYLELVVARDPAGRPRVIDWYSYNTGELAHKTMAAAVLPLLRDLEQPLLVRLLRGRAGGPSDEQVRSLQKVQEALRAGRPAEALALWEQAPAQLRTSRADLVARLACAKELGDEEYQRTIDLVHASFPDDPGLALVLLDWHYLRKDWDGAIGCVDRVLKGVGGDAYLEVLKASLLQEAGREADAGALLRRALERPADLADTYWMCVSVSLKRRDWNATARCLAELEERFGAQLSGVATDPLYAEYVRSAAYRARRAGTE